MIIASRGFCLEDGTTCALYGGLFVLWMDALLHHNSPFGTDESGGRMYLKPLKIASINEFAAYEHGPKVRA